MNNLNLFDRETRSLQFTFVINGLLAVASFVLLFLDSRTLVGISPWIKPIKFQVSIMIFVATVAWIARYLETTLKRKLATQISTCMLIEILIITLQAARGVRSHYNIGNPLDGILFGIMGVAIAYNTYLLGKLLYHFLRGPISLPRVYLRGIQYSLVSILIATVPGSLMIAWNSHTVGAQDGGPGLPFLNWSLLHGDLRVAHFIGMHGFQAFIILGALLTFGKIRLSERRAMGLLNLSFAIFLAITIGTFIQAALGHPFL
jgi:hypothetical protein